MSSSRYLKEFGASKNHSLLIVHYATKLLVTLESELFRPGAIEVIWSNLG